MNWEVSTLEINKSNEYVVNKIKVFAPYDIFVVEVICEEYRKNAQNIINTIEI